MLPTDPRNPLGKVKIPLGYGYLLHQAKGPQDMGGLVSHGCVRVLQRDLYDLSDKLVAAIGLDVRPEQIAAAKRNKNTLVAEIDPALTVEITYDTIVVEDGYDDFGACFCERSGARLVGLAHDRAHAEALAWILEDRSRQPAALRVGGAEDGYRPSGGYDSDLP